MNLRELRPNLWLTELVLDDFDVRGAVVVGERRVLVWDTLSQPSDMAAVKALVGVSRNPSPPLRSPPRIQGGGAEAGVNLVDSKPVIVVYSHADWDHCWGTAGLDADMVIGHAQCGRRFADGEAARKLAQKREQEPGQWASVKLIAPSITFTGYVRVDLGGVTVELHDLPGHTEDCLVAWIPQWGMLLAGDTVETPLPYLNDSSVDGLPQWIGELERWADDERVQTVVPAHGVVGDRALIAQTAAYLRDLGAGKATVVPETMSAFYTTTHAKNQAVVRAGK